MQSDLVYNFGQGLDPGVFEKPRGLGRSQIELRWFEIGLTFIVL
jgi:hypothetical protein